MISIITPVYGKSDYTTEFIRSIVPWMKPEDELIIVDNNSPDNTLSVLNIIKKQYRQARIKIYSHYKNAGFGTANNIGVSLSKNEKLLFISNDVKILNDVITPVENYLSEHPRDAVGPRLLAVNTGWNYFNEVGVIPYLEGFCFALSKTWFDYIGGFDENIFIDMEDLDLCFRLYQAGIGLAQMNLPVMHNLGGSFSQLPHERLKYTLESQAYILKKYKFTKP